MRDFLYTNFSVDAAKLTWHVHACAVLIWIATVYCTLWSINQQPFNRRERLSWSVIVICVPLFGVLAYLPKAWYNAATGALSFWKKPKKKKKFYGY